MLLTSWFSKRWVKRSTFDNVAKNRAEAYKEVLAKNEILVTEAIQLRQRCEELREMHVPFRIGSITLDPFELTARLHAIEGSLKAEYDGKRIVITASGPLPEAEMNAVKAALAPNLNLT